jgi:hypothetical protein
MNAFFFYVWVRGNSKRSHSSKLNNERSKSQHRLFKISSKKASPIKRLTENGTQKAGLFRVFFL